MILPHTVLQEQKKTLDVQHTSVLQQVQSNQSCSLELHRALEKTRNDISIIKVNPRSSWSDEEFEAFERLSDAEITLMRDIDDRDAQLNENEYYLRTAGILYDYYDIIEKGPSSSSTAGSSPPSVKKHKANINNNILSYFSSLNLKEEDAGMVDSNRKQCTEVLLPPTPTQKPLSNDRATLLDKYIASTYAEGPLRHFKSEEPLGKGNNGAAMVCTFCGCDNHTTLLQEGCIVCNECQSVEYIIVDHDKPSYKDPPKEIAYFAYKRINHLNEWLNQVQGKETTEIPEDVFISIILEIKKQKISNMATLTRKKIKDILKKLKINKYYEHVPHIMHRLNGIPTPHMTPELEDKLRHMFCMIQVPFLKYSPATRKNFLSYSYCLHKMMQLLEKDQYLDSFPLLKSREKLHQQDQIWRKICEDIGWDFIPSL